MRMMFVWLLLVFLISQAGLVLASDERVVFIIDKEGDAKHQYQALFAANYGYYIEAQEIELNVPENVTNLQFYDSNGELTPTKVMSDGGFKAYTLNMKEVEYGYPYVVGFTYDLPKYTVARYKENYFFEYYTYLEQDSHKEIHVCIPESASTFVKSYDSTPVEYSTMPDFEYIVPPKFLPLIPLKYQHFGTAEEYYKTKEEQFQEIDVCPNGYSDNLISDVNKGGVTRIKFDFSDASSQVDNHEFEFAELEVAAPVVYEQVLMRNIPLIEKILPSIDSVLNLNSPWKYRLVFVGDNDGVLEGESFHTSSEGVVYGAVTALGDSDQFVQVNILRALISSAMLNTYGAETDTSWWTTGALTNLALIVMKENGLPTNDIQLVLNDVKDAFKGLTTNQIIGVLTAATNTEDEVRITAGIVDEIDTYCPNHVIKLNKIAKNLNDLNFASDEELNNYILYNLRDECSKDISEIFDKYQLAHGNVRVAVDKLRNLQEKFSRIKTKRNDMPEINTININLNSAQANLKLGKVEEALRLLDLSENIYETKLKRLLVILEEYASAENKAEAIPFIFFIPSKPVSYSKLDDAMEFIKTEEFDSARTAINKSLFWSNNAIILSLVLDAVIVGLIALGFRARLKSKPKRSSNHDRSEN